MDHPEICRFGCGGDTQLETEPATRLTSNMVTSSWLIFGSTKDWSAAKVLSELSARASRKRSSGFPPEIESVNPSVNRSSAPVGTNDRCTKFILRSSKQSKRHASRFEKCR